MLRKSFTWLAKAEDILLVAVLVGLLVMALGQILLRNLFDTGVIWFDPASRILVLWLALIAAGIATREKQHLAIDLLHLFPKIQPVAKVIVALFSAAICLLIAWHSVELVQYEFEDGVIAFAQVPSWLTQLIIPLSFSLMGLRFLLQPFARDEEEGE